MISGHSDVIILALALRSPTSELIMPSSAAHNRPHTRHHPRHLAQMAQSHASLLRPLTTPDDEFPIPRVDTGLSADCRPHETWTKTDGVAGNRHTFEKTQDGGLRKRGFLHLLRSGVMGRLSQIHRST